MTQIIYFSLALLFGLFVVWRCARELSKYLHAKKLARMRWDYSAISLWIRLADSVADEAAREAAFFTLCTSEYYTDWLYFRRCMNRARLATVNMIKFRLT